MKQTLQCSLLGAPLGALVGDVVGKGNKARWAGAGAGVAICAIIADQIERKRKAALAHERDLDQRIAAQRDANATIRADNAALRQQLADLRRKRDYLQRTRSGQAEERARLAGEIQGEAEAARERVKIVNDRIAFVEDRLRQRGLSQEEQAALYELRGNLIERRDTLRQIAMLA